ncbi:Solute carrier family 35 member G1 [Holothuria leucospilota]|uniref:Solute carrier family 35 member G1 n=1 Tax=Holothuria leucospilota TaxID=206669 RepID=A0A9Q1HMF7_HOLLE|nr:Solute carrier family 35 member G1 [Holothuria leucospilota]
MALADFLELHKGSIHCITFGVMVTLQANLAKVLTYSSHTSYITFIRSVFAVFMAMPFVEWDASDKHDVTDLLLYLSSAISNVMLCGLGVLGFNYLGVGDSTAIEFGGSLILVGVIGHFFLNERLSILYLILLLFDCVGIVLVVQPSFVFGTPGASSEGREIGAIITLGAAFFFAMWHVVVRKLAQRNALRCWLMIYTHGLVGLAMAGAWTAVESAWQVPDTWFSGIVFIGNGVASTIQLVTGFKALTNEDAKKVALVLTLSVVLSYVLQLTAFGEELEWISITGGIIVVVCVVLSECWDYIKDKINNL